MHGEIRHLAARPEPSAQTGSGTGRYTLARIKRSHGLLATLIIQFGELAGLKTLTQSEEVSRI